MQTYVFTFILDIFLKQLYKNVQLFDPFRVIVKGYANAYVHINMEICGMKKMQIKTVTLFMQHISGLSTGGIIMNQINNTSKSFMMYKEWEETFLALESDAERGELLRALFVFARTGDIPEFKGGLKIAFLQMSNQLRRDAEKYEKKCERNRANANKRWGNNNNAFASESIPKDAVYADKDKEEDKDKEKDKYKDEDEDKDKDKDKDEERPAVQGPINDLTSSEPPAPIRNKYGEFGNILLSNEEREQLIKRFGMHLTDVCIERMDSYMEQTGKCYNNCYAKLKNWISEEHEKVRHKRTNGSEKEHTYFTDKELEDYEHYARTQASDDFAKELEALVRAQEAREKNNKSLLSNIL